MPDSARSTLRTQETLNVPAKRPRDGVGAETAGDSCSGYLDVTERGR
jgi:hypothetical protein